MQLDPERSEQFHQDLTRLADEVHRLNRHRFIRVQNSFFMLILFQFVRGLALGFGTVIGASALVSVIGVMELTLAAQQAISRTYRPFEFYLAAAFCYYIVNLALEAGLRRMERRIAASR